MYHQENNQENISVTACDNGFIVTMYIPIEYNPEFAIADRMLDKIGEMQNKQLGEDWKNEPGNSVNIPVTPKSHYVYVCKDEAEVLKFLKDFFARCKK